MPPITKNLGIVKAIFVGTSPPTNQMVLWFDDRPDQKFLRWYNTVISEWVPLFTDGGNLTGGTTGQILSKASNDDGDFIWIDAPSGGGVPPGGTTGQILIKQSATDGDADWADFPFATQTQVDEGTSTTTIVNPATLNQFFINKVPYINLPLESNLNDVLESEYGFLGDHTFIDLKHFANEVASVRYLTRPEYDNSGTSTFTLRGDTASDSEATIISNLNTFAESVGDGNGWFLRVEARFPNTGSANDYEGSTDILVKVVKKTD